MNDFDNSYLISQTNTNTETRFRNFFFLLLGMRQNEGVSRSMLTKPVQFHLVIFV